MHFIKVKVVCSPPGFTWTSANQQAELIPCVHLAAGTASSGGKTPCMNTHLQHTS